MRKFLHIFSILICLAMFHEASAQKKPISKRKPFSKVISCGICNNEAIYLPKPEYPPAAQAINISGSVNVQILIDEKGNVVLAKAVSGHLLLRPAAVKAALKAKFTPVLLSKKPVKVLGTIVYNFVR